MSPRVEQCQKCGEPRRVQTQDGRILSHATLTRSRGFPSHAFQATGPMPLGWPKRALERLAKAQEQVQADGGDPDPQQEPECACNNANHDPMNPNCPGW